MCSEFANSQVSAVQEGDVDKDQSVKIRNCRFSSLFGAADPWAAVEIDQMCLHVGGGTGETVEEGAESSWSRETPDGTDRQRHTLVALRPCVALRCAEQLPRVIAEGLSAGFLRYLKCEHVNHTKTQPRGSSGLERNPPRQTTDRRESGTGVQTPSATSPSPLRSLAAF